MNVRRTAFRSGVALAHVLALGAALALASYFRWGSDLWAAWHNIIDRPVLGIATYCVFALGIFALSGLYRFHDTWSVRSEIVKTARAVFVLAIATVTALFFFDYDIVSRRFLISFFILAWLFMTMATVATRRYYIRRRRHGMGARNIVLVGSRNELGLHAQSLIHDHPELGLHVVGFVGDPPECPNDTEWLGPLDVLGEVLARNGVDEVLVAPSTDRLGDIDIVALAAEEQGKTVRVPLPSLGPSLARGTVDSLSGTHILSVIPTPDRAAGLALKRGIDIVGSALGLVILSPIFAFAAIGTWISDGRPIFYVQKRSGLNGREFRLYKYRTMHEDAETQRSGLLALSERDGPAFKMQNDPRVTSLGQFLRRSSIDELPQLVNVLRGQMSLVGPRPMAVIETAELTFADRRRMSMRPGITCLWQVYARNDPSWERWVDLDLEYIDNWSVASDLRILSMTPIALVKTPGS